jgi:hypothetical protein
MNQCPAEAVNSSTVGADWISDSLHNLRTPLVSLQGYTRIVLEERVGPLNALQREYLQIVMDSTHRIVGLLNELSSQVAPGDAAAPASVPPAKIFSPGSTIDS